MSVVTWGFMLALHSLMGLSPAFPFWCLSVLKVSWEMWVTVLQANTSEKTDTFDLLLSEMSSLKAKERGYDAKGVARVTSRSTQ